MNGKTSQPFGRKPPDVPLHIGRLRWKLNHGHALDDDEAAYVKALIDQDRPRRKRGTQRATELKRRRVATTVFRYQHEYQCKREAAVRHAMAEHRVGREYVFDAIRAAAAPLRVSGHQQRRRDGPIRPPRRQVASCTRLRSHLNSRDLGPTGESSTRQEAVRSERWRLLSTISALSQTRRSST